MTKEKKQGNPNPSPETRFGGPRGNPMGKTKRQKELEYENGVLASEARNRMLTALTQALAEKSSEEIAAILSGGDILKLLKDSEDRAFGGPKASVDLSSEDGTMTPKTGLDVSKLSVQALTEIMRAADAAKRK
jgi:hypothetical protein